MEPERAAYSFDYPLVRFARYHFLLAFNSTLTDSMYFVTIQICQNLKEQQILLFNFNYIRDLTNRRKLFSIPVTKYASFSHHARPLKTNLLDLILNFSKHYFKTGTICLLFLSSNAFNASEFNSIILLSYFVK